jgi:flagellar biosynthesis regulator FlaF
MFLPTRQQLLDNAAAELRTALEAVEQAAAWLRSDWTPVGASLTAEQAQLRQHLRQAIAEATPALRDALHR